MKIYNDKDERKKVDMKKNERNEWGASIAKLLTPNQFYRYMHTYVACSQGKIESVDITA